MKGKRNSSSGITGTYVYDKKLNKVVKISNRIPKVSSKGEKEGEDFSEESSPCGREACSGGTCAESGEEWN